MSLFCKNVTHTELLKRIAFTWKSPLFLKFVFRGDYFCSRVKPKSEQNLIKLNKLVLFASIELSIK